MFLEPKTLYILIAVIVCIVLVFIVYRQTAKGNKASVKEHDAYIPPLQYVDSEGYQNDKGCCDNDVDMLTMMIMNLLQNKHAKNPKVADVRCVQTILSRTIPVVMGKLNGYGIDMNSIDYSNQSVIDTMNKIISVTVKDLIKDPNICVGQVGPPPSCPQKDITVDVPMCPNVPPTRVDDPRPPPPGAPQPSQPPQPTPTPPKLDGEILLGVGKDAQLYKKDSFEKRWELVKNQKPLRSVHVMRNGWIIGVGTDNKLWGKKNIDGPWTPLHTQQSVGDVIDVSDAQQQGSLIGIGTDSKLYWKRSVLAPWTLVEDKKVDIVAVHLLNGSNTFVGVGTDNNILSSNELKKGWSRIDNSCCVLDVTQLGSGVFIGVNMQNEMIYRDSLTSAWKSSSISDSCCVTRVTVMKLGITPPDFPRPPPDLNNEVLLGVGTDNKLYRKNSFYEPWKLVSNPGLLVSVHVMRNGWIIGVDADKKKLWGKRNIDDPWTPLHTPQSLGEVIDVCDAKQDGSLIGIGTDSKLYWKRSVFAPWMLMDDKKVDITAIHLLNGNNLFAGVGTNNSIVTSGELVKSNWTQIDNTCCVLDVTQISTNHIVAVGKDNRVYYRDSLDPKVSWAADFIDNSCCVTRVAVMKLGITPPNFPRPPPDLNNEVLLGVGKDKQLYRKTSFYEPWKLVPNPGSLLSVHVMRNGWIIGVGDDMKLWVKMTIDGMWTLIDNNTCCVIDVCENANGQLIGVGTDKKLYIRSKLYAPWTLMDDKTGNVTALHLLNGSTTFMGVGTDTYVYSYTDVSKEWSQIANTCCVLDVTQISTNHIVAVGTDNRLYYRDSLDPKVSWAADFIDNSCCVTRVAVMKLGVTPPNFPRPPPGLNNEILLGVGTDNQLYRKNSFYEPWKLVQNPGSLLSVHVMRNGWIIGVGTDKALWGKTSIDGTWNYLGKENCCVIDVCEASIDGRVIGIGADSKLYQKNRVIGPWSPLGDNTCCVKAVHLLNDNSTLIGVDNGDKGIWRFNNQRWTEIEKTCCVMDVTQISSGHIVAVGTDRKLYYRDNLNPGAPWQSDFADNSCCVTRVAVMKIGMNPPKLPTPLPSLENEILLGVGTDNKLYKKDSLYGPWVPVEKNNCCVKSVHVTRQGWILGVGTDNKLWVKKGLEGPWTPIGDNSCCVLDVCDNERGHLIGVGTDNKLYMRDSLYSAWNFTTEQTCCVTAIIFAKDNKTYFGVGRDRQLYATQSFDAKWRPIPNSGNIIDVCQINSQVLLAVGEDNRVWFWHENKWNPAWADDNSCCVRSITSLPWPYYTDAVQIPQPPVQAPPPTVQAPPPTVVQPPPVPPPAPTPFCNRNSYNIQETSPGSRVFTGERPDNNSVRCIFPTKPGTNVSDVPKAGVLYNYDFW